MLGFTVFTAYMFNPSVTLGFKYQLLPRMEEF